MQEAFTRKYRKRPNYREAGVRPELRIQPARYRSLENTKPINISSSNQNLVEKGNKIYIQSNIEIYRFSYIS